MKKIILAALLALLASPALAQSTCPSIFTGAVLSAGQWQACFQAKNNTLGYTPVNKAGDTMQGELITSPSSTVSSGFNLPPGVAATSPVNGDFWSTSSGFYGQAAGTTVGPFIGASSATFAATLPMAVTFPSNVVTYALQYNTSLALVASNLGINLAHSNLFTAAQGIDLNAAALPAAQTGTALQVGQANTVAARIELDAFGAVPRFTCVREDGTAASPTTLQANDEICSINSFGYNGTAIVGPMAALRTYAAQNWTTGAQGTYADIAVTPNGSTTLAESIRFENDGGITVPSTVTGGDKGAGTINATGYYINGTSIGTGPFLPLAGGALSGALTYGGVTLSNSVTGTGAMVLASSPSIASPTFTTAVTATGLITLADLATQTTNTALVNATAGTASPTAQMMPNCSSAGQALIWTTNTGFGCGTITATASAITIATTTITSGATNTILYQNGASPTGTIGEITTANNSVLTTNGSGVPSLNTTLPSGLSAPSLTVTTAFTATGLVTLGDIATQATNTVLVNATSGSASPTAQAVSSCSAAADALIWTTNTGLGCNTSITAAAVPANGLTGTTLSASVVTSSLTTVGALASGSLASGFTQITNALLANSTISGISLGNNLDVLTFGTHLAAGGSSYNGSAGVTITSDATAADTVSTIMARDGSGQVAATTFTGALTGHASLDLALAGGTMSGNIAMGGNAITGGGAITGALGTFSSLAVTGNVKLSGISGGTIAYAVCTDSSGNLVPNSSANCYSGGSASAGGSNTDAQYNASGSLAGNAGWTYDGTSVTSLGVAGTSVGGVKLFNATSGSVLLNPVPGALGTVTASFPANSGIVSELNLAETFTGTKTITGTSSTIAAVLTNVAEPGTFSATAATGTITIYPSTQSVLYYTSAASADWTVNFAWSSGTTMNTAMSVGQSVTVVFEVTQGSTAYYNNTVEVDGATSGVTTQWQGGIAPTIGNASGIDVYTYTIQKVGSATYTVLASQTQF
jgi:hypothetical protein